MIDARLDRHVADTRDGHLIVQDVIESRIPSGEIQGAVPYRNRYTWRQHVGVRGRQGQIVQVTEAVEKRDHVPDDLAVGRFPGRLQARPCPHASEIRPYIEQIVPEVLLGFIRRRRGLDNAFPGRGLRWLLERHYPLSPVGSSSAACDSLRGSTSTCLNCPFT